MPMLDGIRFRPPRDDEWSPPPRPTFGLWQLFGSVVLVALVCAWYRAIGNVPEDIKRFWMVAIPVGAVVGASIGWPRRLFHGAILGVLIPLACLSFLSMAISSVDPSIEVQDLTYERFRKRFGTEGLDPVGADEISYCRRQSRDGYDTYVAMTIAEPDFRRAAEAMSAYLEDPQRAPFVAQASARLRKVEDRGPIAGPPGPSADAPPWWHRPAAGQSLTHIKWEVDDGPHTMGWLWVYDTATSRLWIWEWNR